MTAYYNEIDPYAAEWLRNLIKAGHIAPGVVDTRSVEDVTPADLKDFTQCHFFAGVGVWSYALRLGGWHDDRPVWTGSCPCQPFSAAGKGGGFTDERHLWPAWFHLIEQCRPSVIYGEQVADRGGLAWLDLVSTDMEGTDYAFGSIDTCSAGFGAPHRRQRLRFIAMDNAERARLERFAWNGHRSGQPGWLAPLEAGYVAASSASGIVADNTGQRREMAILDHRGGIASSGVRQANVGGSDGASGRLADDNGVRLEQIAAPGFRADTEHDAQSLGGAGDMGDATSRGCGVGGNAPRARDSGHPHGSDIFGGMDNAERDGWGTRRDDDRGDEWQQPHTIDLFGRLADTEHDGRWSDVARRQSQGGIADGRVGTVGGMADTDDGTGLRGEPRAIERVDAQGIGTVQTEPDRPRPTNGFWRAADWLFCRDGKWRPVEPGTFPLAHGATSRVGRLRAYGNAVDAQATKAFIDATIDL